MNVMWHGGTGDTDPEKRGDFAFLHAMRVARHGGVLLIHDYIRIDALTAVLKSIARSIHAGRDPRRGRGAQVRMPDLGAARGAPTCDCRWDTGAGDPLGFNASGA
ncbi:MAG: hypothetical protein ACOC1F_00425 [Myxococcota bacterium]